MILLSALLVFGTTAVILGGMSAQDGRLPFGYEQLIHARIPWILLGLLWTGTALGVAAVMRRRGLLNATVLFLELPLVALASWYFLAFSTLPAHELAIGVGDPFPPYSLVDQDGALHEFDGATPHDPTLYIFYRGDW
jgi:hypothetical protein